MKTISEEKISQIKNLYDEGLSNSKIAEKLEIGKSTVSKYLKERFNIVGKKYVKHIEQDKFEE